MSQQRIQKSASNLLTFTLNEKTTLTDAKYLLELYSGEQNITKVARLSGDTSLNLNRYNQFTLVETSNEDLDTLHVSLLVGQYDYFIWQTSATTLNTTDALSVVESGKLIVLGTDETLPTLENNNQIHIFNG